MNRRSIRRSVFSSVAVSALVLTGAANAQETDAATTEDDTVISVIEEDATEGEAR